MVAELHREAHLVVLNGKIDSLKWYDGEYETWSFEDGYRVNGGWRKYWVVNEKGEKEEIPKAHMKAIFEFDIQQLREEKLKDILN